jgi:hypothetical protein
MDDERGGEPPAAVPFPLAHERDEGMTLATEKMRSFGHDPLERLKRVQQQLASIDSDDEIGTSGTEIDLSFEPQLSANPFSEQFADEEVVLDPYAGIEFDPLYNRPIVESEEGRRLGALLKSAPSPHLAVTEELEIGFGGGVELSEENEPTPVDDHSKSEFPESQSQAGCSPLLSFTQAQVRDPQIMPPAAGYINDDTLLNGEAEMIVIEEEPAAAPHVSVVPRQQLRYQFANMRRR